jgi:hypothetical protein
VFREGANALFSNYQTRSTFSSLGSVQKITLPIGTQRRETKEFEEVKIPAPPLPPLTDEERFISISEFDEWAQIVFKAFFTYISTLKTHTY